MHRNTVDRREVARIAANAGLKLPRAVVGDLAVYLEMLCQWNAVMNLVGFRAWRDILVRLVFDGFYLAEFLEKLHLPENALSWDLGSGAGLPGIPLRLVWGRGTYYLVEVREKRALFLTNVLARLQLADTHVFHGSAENFFQKQALQANCIVSRAFMPWRSLLDTVFPRLRSGGFLIISTLTPAPEMPEAWRLAGTHSYEAGGDTRWFWAVTPTGEAGACRK
ncbi:MAG: class I SAM-dependent methyltransferase [Desulfovibrio sp.]|jgi:16S rRNA (guanine527-N7)-methyltransferase|nr:class I SAM-dependent methyltransferase [Desulfovibrio sp.]